MRNTIILAIMCVAFTACNKDKFTTAPQIKYESVNPNFTSIDIGEVFWISLSVSRMQKATLV